MTADTQTARLRDQLVALENDLERQADESDRAARAAEESGLPATAAVHRRIAGIKRDLRDALARLHQGDAP